jgi:predicted nuclease with RNAse H fold
MAGHVPSSGRAEPLRGPGVGIVQMNEDDIVDTGVVAGIDVGGKRKGCHLVILHGTRILLRVKSGEPRELLDACLAHDVQVVGIDAPCLWSQADGRRLAEQELTSERIFCFSTPTRERAEASAFYNWMLSGEQIYETFATTFPLLTSEGYEGGRVSFETFPHAIACAFLSKEIASAKKKRVQRRNILRDAHVDITSLRSIDEVDAALCALTAGYLLAGEARAYGDAKGGYIRVPLSRGHDCQNR